MRTLKLLEPSHDHFSPSFGTYKPTTISIISRSVGGKKRIRRVGVTKAKKQTGNRRVVLFCFVVFLSKYLTCKI